MNDKSDELVIWGAVGPHGELVKSSVGTFKSVAARWALRRGNYEVVKLGTIPSPGKAEEEEMEEEAPKVETPRVAKKAKERTIMSHRRRQALPESDMELASGDTPAIPPTKEMGVPEKFKIDRSFFGRRRKKRK